MRSDDKPYSQMTPSELVCVIEQGEGQKLNDSALMHIAQGFRELEKTETIVKSR